MKWASFRSALTTAGPALALIGIIAGFAFFDWQQDGESTFLTVRNLRVMVQDVLPVAVAALGMTVIIAAGGIDLSAGTMLALCAVVLAASLKAGCSAGTAMLLAVACGAACGALNGVLIASLGVVPFVVTLGTLGAFEGAAKIVAEETTVRPGRDAIPSWLGRLTSIQNDSLVLGLPGGAWVLLGLAIAVAVVLRLTVFGRHLFAIGSNEKTARLCGVSVGRTKVLVYALGGLLTGAAGVMQFSQLNAGSPTSGLGMELQVIAAVVIGGGSLSGGRGGVFGTLTGVAIVAAIESGGFQLGWSNPVQQIALGAIIVAAVAADRARARSGG
ncbi:ABC transporter permease [Alienimonas chondri]|uniref:Ribose import permease protein RbsC n=1 Tax=Alienimonas chondri TaxID=2681879 RepID=A0ABX1VAW8_9PLAN|nr:ABC transporter permease [Alienimonas chondri]NNJ24918.1 Ribose import permease protein RbsC [Alienimonas chondri]